MKRIKRDDFKDGYGKVKYTKCEIGTYIFSIVVILLYALVCPLIGGGIVGMVFRIISLASAVGALTMTIFCVKASFSMKTVGKNWILQILLPIMATVVFLQLQSFLPILV